MVGGRIRGWMGLRDGRAVRVARVGVGVVGAGVGKSERVLSVKFPRSVWSRRLKLEIPSISQPFRRLPRSASLSLSRPLPLLLRSSSSSRLGFGFFVLILILGNFPFSKCTLIRSTIVGRSLGPSLRRRESEDGAYWLCSGDGEAKRTRRRGVGDISELFRLGALCSKKWAEESI